MWIIIRLSVILFLSLVGTLALTKTAPQSLSRTTVVSYTLQVLNIAYFDDKNDRQSLNDLRRRRSNGENIIKDESAILQAGNRIGTVFWPECIGKVTNQPLNGNAFLIEVEGRDAIITSAHLIVERDGSLRENCLREELKRAQYWPNSSYFETAAELWSARAFASDQVSVFVDNRFGGSRLLGALEDSDDWIILFPERSDAISSQIAPDGALRGALSFLKEDALFDEQFGYIIGLDSRQTSGVTTYQRCLLRTFLEFSYNSCDTDRQSSGSILGVINVGKLEFHSINNLNSRALKREGTHLLPSDYFDWNKGLTSQHILNEINNTLP